MARLIKHEAKIPKEIQVDGKSAWICMCGLSNKKPMCDGAHNKAKSEEEGKLYAYDKEGNRIEIVTQFE